MSRDDRSASLENEMKTMDRRFALVDLLRLLGWSPRVSPSVGWRQSVLWFPCAVSCAVGFKIFPLLYNPSPYWSALYLWLLFNTFPIWLDGAVKVQRISEHADLRLITTRTKLNLAPVFYHTWLFFLRFFLDVAAFSRHISDDVSNHRPVVKNMKCSSKKLRKPKSHSIVSQLCATRSVSNVGMVCLTLSPSSKKD